MKRSMLFLGAALAAAVAFSSLSFADPPAGVAMLQPGVTSHATPAADALVVYRVEAPTVCVVDVAARRPRTQDKRVEFVPSYGRTLAVLRLEVRAPDIVTST